MNKLSKRLSIAGAAGALALLGGCWGDSSNDVAVAPPTAVDDNSIPVSAGASTAAFFAYVQALPASETAEPRTISATFTVPAEDTAEPTPLT